MSPEQQEKWAYRIMAVLMLIFIIYMFVKGGAARNEEDVKTVEPTAAVEITTTPEAE